MEELIKRLERVIQTGAPDKDGMHPISAETVLEVVRGLSEHGTNLAEVGTSCSEFPNNSDAISRQAAIDALGELATFTEDWSCHTWMYTDDVYNAIKQLPPIQPKRSRWIGKYPVTSVCSECGFLIHDSKVKAFAYCPNCGADMREVTT